MWSTGHDSHLQLPAHHVKTSICRNGSGTVWLITVFAWGTQLPRQGTLGQSGFCSWSVMYTRRGGKGTLRLSSSACSDWRAGPGWRCATTTPSQLCRADDRLHCHLLDAESLWRTDWASKSFMSVSVSCLHRGPAWHLPFPPDLDVSTTHLAGSHRRAPVHIPSVSAGCCGLVLSGNLRTLWDLVAGRECVWKRPGEQFGPAPL
ncbi:hypothetical protein EDC01DRAFT_409575 [Geopyxis carbonaria]|nr:hypothetical protein EDC01DRAFT_409575 [Geopyxis carbonaria]